MINKEKTVKITKTVFSVLWWILLLLSALLLVSVLSAKARGKVPKVFGYSVMRIVSKSMEPTIEQDSYILVKDIAPEEVKNGDIICFYSDDPVIYGFPNTHRVVAEPYVGNDGDVYFTTAGDNSPANDKVAAKGERLIGIYAGDLNFLEAFERILSKNTVMIFVIVIEACFFIIALFSILKGREGKKKSLKRSDGEEAEQSDPDK